MDKKTNKLILPILLLSMGINIFMYSKISRIENDLRNLNNQISGLQSNLDSSINSISYTVTEGLKKEASVINDFQFEYGQFKDGLVDLSLKVKPKEISNENTYYFSYTYENSKPQIIPAIKGDGYDYYADIKVPIKDNVEVDFVIENNNAETVETLDYIYNFEEKLLEDYDLRRESESTSFGSNVFSLKDSLYEVSHYPYEYDMEKDSEKKSKSIKKATFYFTINDKIIDSFPMKNAKDPFPDYMNIYEIEFEDYSIEVKNNDILELYIIAEHEDNYKIRFNVEKFEIDGQGKPIHGFAYDERKFIVE